MKLQRFYIKELHNRYGPISLGHELWLNDHDIVHQLLKVFRAKPGYQLILFNDQEERLYKITDIGDDFAVKLSLVTDIIRKLPQKEIYLLWSVLKKDKNDWILQKCTELGVHKFVPVIASRSEKTDINLERAQKIIIEATEQCGRGDIPILREPILLHEALEEYQDLPLFICEQNAENSQTSPEQLDRAGILIGPEGGWDDSEKTDFKNRGLPHIVLSDFTLRAETAAIAAVSKLLS
jgi:16S rRNA (uracil1498-N3)-methyltransferase